MDKVDFSRNMENVLNTGLMGGAKAEIRKARDKPGIREAKRRNFSDALERSILENQDMGPLHTIDPSEEAVQNLLDEIRSCADSLKHRPFPEEMLNYKKAVREFLHYVVENSYKVEQTEKEKYVSGSYKTFIHQHIRVVDKKLEELAAGILMKQISELDLKNRLDEITGLLIDLTVTGKITQ